MKRPPSSRPTEPALRVGFALPAALALAACADRAERIPVCPLPLAIAAEAAPLGSWPVAWAPVGTLHLPAGWRARVGPHSESVMQVGSPGGAAEMILEASCCRGSDLFRNPDAALERWSGRAVWIGERTEAGITAQSYFTFPFARIETESLRRAPDGLLRPPFALSAAGRCRTPRGCAELREIVRSIGYDGEATRLAQQGDERVARIGASAARQTAPAPASPAGPPPPPPPPEPEPLFTPDLCAAQRS